MPWKVDLVKHKIKLGVKLTWKPMASPSGTHKHHKMGRNLNMTDLSNRSQTVARNVPIKFEKFYS